MSPADLDRRARRRLERLRAVRGALLDLALALVVIAFLVVAWTVEAWLFATP